MQNFLPCDEHCTIQAKKSFFFTGFKITYDSAASGKLFTEKSRKKNPMVHFFGCS